MYAGGLSYFSSGLVVRGFHVGATCAEAVASAARNAIKGSCRSHLAVLVPLQLQKGASTRLRCVVAKRACILLGIVSESARFIACDTPVRAYGRGAGVGRGLGVGVILGRTVAVAVAVAVGVGVAVAVAVGVGVGVGVAVGDAVGVGVGLGPPARLNAPIRNRQPLVLVVGMYSLMYQKVVSSVGSTTIEV